MNKNKSTNFDALKEKINSDSKISEKDKDIAFENIKKLQNTKVNILITGATGCGKSSTINALFNAQHAIVGQSPNPETMHISKYEMGNLTLYDTPGLGDGKEADIRHSKSIIDLMHKCDEKGEYTIDLVLVILDGSSRDLGKSFELINQVIIPNLGEDKNRILIAINQADMAMKGRFWNNQENHPENKLKDFLDEKVISTRKRILEATGVSTEPVYYSAGYKEENNSQNPYNLSKLLLQMLLHVKTEKRVVLASKVNSEDKMWKDDDGLKNYQKEADNTVRESWASSMTKGMASGAAMGAAIGSLIPVVGTAIGGTIGVIVGGIISLFSGF